MRIHFSIEVDVDHESGKFVSKDELAEQIVTAIEGADEGSWYVDESEYTTAVFNVQVLS